MQILIHYLKFICIIDLQKDFQIVNILKGRYYLSTLFGVENRTTIDIDTAFRNANFNEETIVKIIKEIVSIEQLRTDKIKK